MNTKSLSANPSFDAYTPRIIALGLLTILLLSAATGCKNQNRALAAADPTGVYTLHSVNSQTVPCDLKHEGTTMTIKSGTFTIDPDGTCRSLMNFSVPQHEGLSREVKARYTQAGAELTMRWEGAGQTQGQINGNQFTMTNEGMVLLYQK